MRAGSAAEVFWAFLMLGLTSFGGPVAHVGYFRAELVGRRGWLDARGFDELAALCQMLPGPASSQLGFALGLMRAGPMGGLAAWVGFTLPSALAMLGLAVALSGAVALGGEAIRGAPVWGGALAGLKLVALAIVAQALAGMAASLCPDRLRAAMALGALALLAALPGPAGMLAAILAGGAAGALLLRGPVAPAGPPAPAVLSRRAGLACLAAFAGLLVLLPLVAALAPGLALADAFYRAGALVFGGGHVVLPLLEAELVRPGLVARDDFLAGYGAVQAVPGPLFTFAAYLGALVEPGPGGPAGAALALVAVFLPGLLLVAGVLPFRAALMARPGLRAAVAGANAAVVGILAAALYDPVFLGAVEGLADLALAGLCLMLLMLWRVPPWAVVALGAGLGAGLALV
jgi:chromate transporter